METPVYYAPRDGGERIFTVTATAMKFGSGCLAELGADAQGLGLKRLAFFTDRTVGATQAADRALGSLKRAGLDVAVYDRVHVEPTDTSLADAIAFATDGGFDGYVSLGGGSVIDTAKAANLFATHPDDLMAYVNAPAGRAQPVPGPIRPHIACPTTCGTGSETTGVVVFDLAERHLKTGISSKFLKPTLAVVDPDTIATLPAGAIAATGFDVLTHAIESYTAMPYTDRAPPDDPALRPPYQGANPYSDIGSLRAIELGGRCLVRAVKDRDDTEARDGLMLAATLAGIAFGNAGVHIPHAMSYSVAGMNHTFRARGYENAEPMVPHGISVVLNAPAAFRFTGQVAPQRHREAAAALGAYTEGADTAGTDANDGGEILAAHLSAMMKETGLPRGLEAIGYSADDIPALVAGAFVQKRLLAQAPRAVGEDDLARLYQEAMRNW